MSTTSDSPIGYKFDRTNIREVYLNNGGGISITGEDESDDPLISMSFDQARELSRILKELAGDRPSAIALPDVGDKP